MNSCKPINPKKRKEVEKSMAFEPYFMYNIFKKYMSHLRFSHLVLHRKVPLTKKLQLVLERNVGPHAHVIVGNTVYKCQVLILRIYCALFRNNLKRGDLVKFPNGVMSNECFEMAYGWMITDQIYCPRGLLLDLLVAADRLKCSALANSLFQCLDDHRQFFDLKAFACFWEAQRRGLRAMGDMMLSRVGKCFLALVCTKGYLRLDVDRLCDVLRSDNLAVQSEIEVFYAALLWLESNYQRRKKFIPRVLSLVRFHIMPYAFLVLWASQLKNLRPYLADQICAIMFNAMLAKLDRRMNPLKSKYTWKTRNWIRDPLCPYEIHLKRNGCCEINVEVFLFYLKCIRKSPDAFLARIRRVNHQKESFIKCEGSIHEPSKSENSGGKSPVDSKLSSWMEHNRESESDSDSQWAKTSTFTASNEFKSTEEEGDAQESSTFSDTSSEFSGKSSTNTTEESSADSFQESSAGYGKSDRKSELDSEGYVLADSETDSSANAVTDSDTDSSRLVRAVSETDSDRYSDRFSVGKHSEDSS
ncbi:uncharacterized protein LOC108028142 [Drosophila biarmipes]|uniref:uncharacterized protein LOC108028142 n=1 Tax=Drosophila biarmipes TaxID=125945 RepID=UPI0007E8177C|nr:uncharacterized protein LOC108028142 [Drosophila biarmipes]